MSTQVRPDEYFANAFQYATVLSEQLMKDFNASKRNKGDKIPGIDIEGFEYLSAGIVGLYAVGYEPDDFALWDPEKTQRWLVNEDAAFTASAAWGSLAFTLAELQNNECFMIHEASGGWVKYLNAKPVPKSAYDIYLEATSDSPVKSEAEWSAPPEPGANGGAEIKLYDPADAPFLAGVVVSYQGKIYQANVTTSAGLDSPDWQPLGGNVTVEELVGDVLKFDKSYKKTLILTADTGQAIDLTDAVDGSRLSLIVQTKGFRYFLPREVVYNAEQLKLGTYTIDLLYNQGVVIANIVSTFPENAYFLENLTQAEIDKGAALSNYLVLRTDTKIQYPFTVTNRSNTTIDTTECILDCYPDLDNPLAGNTIFHQLGSVGASFKFGVVIGDRLKREFINPDERMNESTYLVRMDNGCRDWEFSGIDISGFMGDAISGNQGGTRILLFSHIDGAYMTEIGTTGVYQSAVLPLYPEEGKVIAIYGGVGFNRFPPVKDAKFVFMDDAENILEIRPTEYLQHQKCPDLATKVRVLNSHASGLGNAYFYFSVVLNPAENGVISNSRIRDGHRGAISNVPNNTTIVNCQLDNTSDSALKPAFGDSTRYKFNAEDAVSSFVQILNCDFENNYHSVLFVDCMQFRLVDCNFLSNVFNAHIYNVKKPSEIRGGKWIGGVLSSEGANAKGLIEVSGIEFQNAVVHTNVDFSIHDVQIKGGAVVAAGGRFVNNIVTESVKFLADFRGMRNNTFVDCLEQGYLNPQPDGYVIVPENTFINHPFQANGGGAYLHVGGTYTNTNATVVYEVGYNALQTRIFHNAQLTGLQMVQTRYGGTDLGSHFFYNCQIDIGEADWFFYVYNNTPGTTHNRFYFKNCEITTAVVKQLFVSIYSGLITECVFDNCTINPLVKLDYITPTYAHVVNRCRYIRVYGTGSTADSNTLDFRAIEAYAWGSSTDVCLGKTAKANGVALTGITDGSLTPVSIVTSGKDTFVEIDLGSIMDIEKINVKRITGRTYLNSRVVYAETSDLDAEVVISTASDYIEDIDGLDVEF